MQRILSAIGQAVRKSVLILALITLLLPAVFIAVEQPSLASSVSTEGQKLVDQENRSKASQAANAREQNYEEQIKAAADPDKAYEKNLEAYKQANPGEGLVEKATEGAEKLVDKVTGK